jgi:hypothetical protein
MIQERKRSRRETEICCGAPRGQRGAPKLKCTASITSLSGTRFRWKKEDRLLSKYVASPLECGGRGGIRTHGLLIANEGNKFIRRGVAITCVRRGCPQMEYLPEFSEAQVRRIQGPARFLCTIGNYQGSIQQEPEVRRIEPRDCRSSVQGTRFVNPPH